MIGDALDAGVVVKPNANRAVLIGPYLRTFAFGRHFAEQAGSPVNGFQCALICRRKFDR